MPRASGLASECREKIGNKTELRFATLSVAAPKGKEEEIRTEDIVEGRKAGSGKQGVGQEACNAETRDGGEVRLHQHGNCRPSFKWVVTILYMRGR